MLYLIAALLIAAALYVAWRARTDMGFDWKKGFLALASLIAGVLLMLGDWIGHFAR